MEWLDCNQAVTQQQENCEQKMLENVIIYNIERIKINRMENSVIFTLKIIVIFLLLVRRLTFY
jgi:hypothetical protein